MLGTTNYNEWGKYLFKQCTLLILSVKFCDVVKWEIGDNLENNKVMGFA